MEKYNKIIANGGTVCYNSLGARVSHFRSGGSIDVFLRPRGREGLLTALRVLGDEPYTVVGNLSNTLIGDGGVNGVLLSMQYIEGCYVDGETMTCLAGESLMNVARIAKANSLTGLEELSGIPGSVGGGLYMNCGAYRRYLGDVVDSVDVYHDHKVLTLGRDEMAFGYRDSILRHSNMTVISCKLRLKHHNKVLITNKTKDYQQRRRAMQPEQLSLGCVFKKVGDISAGEYIDRAGLKGTTIGGAMISDKHANFIVNLGGATSGDYKGLVELCKSVVLEKYGVQLHREVIYLGND